MVNNCNSIYYSCKYGLQMTSKYDKCKLCKREINNLGGLSTGSIVMLKNGRILHLKCFEKMREIENENRTKKTEQ